MKTTTITTYKLNL